MSDESAPCYEPAQQVVAVVDQVFSFGVFAHLLDDTPAYIRQRELTLAGNIDPHQVVSEGQEVQTVVIGLPEPGLRLELSVRQAQPDPWEAFAEQAQVRGSVTGTVKWISARGIVVEVIPGVDGFIPLHELAPWSVERPQDLVWVGDQVEAMITHLDAKNKRLRLSIRQQLLHLSRVQQIVRHLRSGPDSYETPPELEEPEAEFREVADLEPLGRILVLDDHRTVRETLVVWLRHHGCQAEEVGDARLGLEQLEQTVYRLALVDLDLAGQDGLDFIRAVRQHHPDVQILVMSIPEWIVKRSQELEALEVTGVFVKPLNPDEVLDTLARLAQGETVGPFRAAAPGEGQSVTDPFQRLGKTMRSGAPLRVRLEAGLADLVRVTRAEHGILFHLEPVSRRTSIVAMAGVLPVRDDGIAALTASPVKDLIVSRGEVFESNVTEQVRRRFQKLLDVVPFESCLGVPVAAFGKVEHALLLFHREPQAFRRFRLRDAQAMAFLLGVALESDALERKIQSTNPFLLSGQLAAGFGHDVFNKMSALEFQVLNLKAMCEVLGQEGRERAAAAEPDCEQLRRDVEQLQETTLDLRETVSAFRELLRAEHQMAIDVNQVVQRAVLLLHPDSERRGVRLDLELAPRLPPVAGSPVRLQQVFLNLMLNAIQHMGEKLQRWPQSPSRLRVTTGSDLGVERPVWVRFIDTGPGIHYHSWENIFALGFSTRSEGTGLGLFIARSLVESMGGAIYVEESFIPSRSVFRVELPTAD